MIKRRSTMSGMDHGRSPIAATLGSREMLMNRPAKIHWCRQQVYVGQVKCRCGATESATRVLDKEPESHLVIMARSTHRGFEHRRSTGFWTFHAESKLLGNRIKQGTCVNAISETRCGSLPQVLIQRGFQGRGNLFARNGEQLLQPIDSALQVVRHFRCEGTKCCTHLVLEFGIRIHRTLSLESARMWQCPERKSMKSCREVTNA